MNGIAKKANRSIGVVSVLTACVKIYRRTFVLFAVSRT